MTLKLILITVNPLKLLHPYVLCILYQESNEARRDTTVLFDLLSCTTPAYFLI